MAGAARGALHWRLCGLPSGCSGPGASHTPSSPLAAGSYTFRVRATDAAGNTDQSPATRAFTVTAAGGPPSIPTTVPTDGFSGFSRSGPVVAVLDQPMDKASVEAAFSLKRSVNGERVSGSFSWYGNALLFIPSAPLALHASTRPRSGRAPAISPASTLRRQRAGSSAPRHNR